MGNRTPPLKTGGVSGEQVRTDAVQSVLATTTCVSDLCLRAREVEHRCGILGATPEEQPLSLLRLVQCGGWRTTSPFLPIDPVGDPASLFRSISLLWLLSRALPNRGHRSDLSSYCSLRSRLSADYAGRRVGGRDLRWRCSDLIFSLEQDAHCSSSIRNDTTWTNLTFYVRYASFTRPVNSSTPLVRYAAFTKFFSFETISCHLLSLRPLAHYGYLNARTLFIDLGRIASFDLCAIDPVGDDYKLRHLARCSVVLCPCSVPPVTRSDATQRASGHGTCFSGLFSEISGTSRGPIVALEEMVTAFAKCLGGLIKH